MAYLAPVYDFGSKEIVAHSISLHPDLAQQEENARHARGGQGPRARSRCCTRTWAGSTSTRPIVATLRENGFHPEHVAQGQTASTTAPPSRSSATSRTSSSGAGTGTRSRGSSANLEGLQYATGTTSGVRRKLEGLTPGGNSGTRPFGRLPSRYDLTCPSFWGAVQRAITPFAGATPHVRSSRAPSSPCASGRTHPC